MREAFGNDFINTFVELKQDGEIKTLGNRTDVSSADAELLKKEWDEYSHLWK